MRVLSAVGGVGLAVVAAGATANGLKLSVEKTDGGLRLASLMDETVGKELLAKGQPPLFEVVLHRAGSGEEAKIAADSGWMDARVVATKSGLSLNWRRLSAPELARVSVSCKAVRDGTGWRWSLEVKCGNSGWTVWTVTFPQLALAEPGEGASVFYPSAAGEMRQGVWTKPFEYDGNYADGWCCMQYMAIFGGGTGLYYGLHDPWGSMKYMSIRSDPVAKSLRMAYIHPAPERGKAGNGFALCGEAVWQPLHGDWFDAAMIYKTWARRHARWWPKLGKDGRPDSPAWFRELNAWALDHGGPECVERVKRFSEFLGVPSGFHWYQWHEIPFDNDYPHYFPTKPGVAEGAKELKRAGVYPMPYINGRLWDIRDKGTVDWQFTKVARPAATKDEHGQPFVESYGSKETDGSDVRLAVMCPTTELWQRTVRELVLRLLGEVGMSAVYIDQVAAAPPKPCQDPSHGHPLGGGHWWNEGYWTMLRKIREAMPAGAALTTECNGEPFVNVFDGYLSWHWQHDGMVPAFPAVYGGAVQMLGRNYAGGGAARRSKTGQQLVFGEQIGWIEPSVLDDKPTAEFLRTLVRLRQRLARYFYAGDMARPPRLAGPVPAVRADWQWYGETWVTVDAVQTGAWVLPAERRIVLLFVNVSDDAVNVTVPLDARSYGLPERLLKLSVVTSDGAGRPGPVAISSQQPLSLPARSAEAWEILW